MKILFLGNLDSPLILYLKKIGEQVIITDKQFDMAFLNKNSPEFLVSYNYKYIIKQEIIDFFKGKAINLHIAFLPWNKGSDPNFWSFIEGTPKGVSIHYLDAGVDTGPIIAQKEVIFFDEEKETLRTTYDKLHIEIQALFIRHWQKMRTGICKGRIQPKGGTYHRRVDKEPFQFLFKDGWDTPISVLNEYLRRKKFNN